MIDFDPAKHLASSAGEICTLDIHGKISLERRPGALEAYMYMFLAILTVVYLWRLQSRIKEKVPIVHHFLDYVAFALITLKLGSVIEWDWLLVLSPLLALTTHRYLEPTIQQKQMETHDRKMRALDEMRKQFAHY